jgi:hypothetical protein
MQVVDLADSSWVWLGPHPLVSRCSATHCSRIVHGWAAAVRTTRVSRYIAFGAATVSSAARGSVSLARSTTTSPTGMTSARGVGYHARQKAREDRQLHPCRCVRRGFHAGMVEPRRRPRRLPALRCRPPARAPSPGRRKSSVHRACSSAVFWYRDRVTAKEDRQRWVRWVRRFRGFAIGA